jgi:hypothetical protein
MPKIIHESIGLNIHKNDVNQFTVVRLHYTADPAKRTDQWRREAMAGMIPAKWQKEYEISYSALFGEKVFPEMSSHREHLLVSEPYPEFPTTQVYWGGFDYGTRNPSSFHVYTIYDGVTYSMWELFEPCRNVSEYVEKMKSCPYWEQIKYIAVDPTIINVKSQQTSNGLVTVGQKFWEAGVTNFLKGHNDETVWMAQMREHWRDPENPTFRIFARCVNQVREFDNAIYANMNERQLMTQNYRENIVDHNNHSLDDCKYFMNSRPRLQQSNIKYPTMTRRWLK